MNNKKDPSVTWKDKGYERQECFMSRSRELQNCNGQSRPRHLPRKEDLMKC